MPDAVTTTPQAPVVRNLNDIIAELNPSIQGQRDLINQQIQDNQTSGDAQIAGLDAAKTRAFSGIVGESQDRGALFSGFTPDKEAEYTGATYLPALANLQRTIAATRGQLMSQNASLDTDVFNKAFASRETDIGAQRDWMTNQDNQQFQTGEREATQNFTKEERTATEAFTSRQQELSNQFTAQQGEIQRAFDAGQNDKANALQVQLAQMKISADKELTQLQIAADNARASAAARASASASAASDSSKQYNGYVSNALQYIKDYASSHPNADKNLDVNELQPIYNQVKQLTGSDTVAQNVLNDAIKSAGYFKYTG